MQILFSFTVDTDTGKSTHAGNVDVLVASRWLQTIAINVLAQQLQQKENQQKEKQNEKVQDAVNIRSPDSPVRPVSSNP